MDSLNLMQLYTNNFNSLFKLFLLIYYSNNAKAKGRQPSCSKKELKRILIDENKSGKWVKNAASLKVKDLEIANAAHIDANIR